jgi:Protein of unknown function (DUF2786)
MEDKILERVRALLAKAERTEFEAEADAYREKAFELVAKYEIDEAALNVNSATGPRPIVVVRRYTEEPYGSLKLILWDQIGRTFGIRSVFHGAGYGKRGYESATCFGTQAAHDMTEFIVTSLLIQAATLLPNVKASVGPKERYYGEPSTRALRIGWLTGFFERCAARVREAHRQASASAEATENGAALILVSDAKRAAEAIAERYPKLGTSRARDSGAREGRAAGRQAGDYANVGTTRIGGSRTALNR